MGLYIVVEGRRTEPQLFRGWLPTLAPLYTEVHRPEDADFYNYRLICGNGYPCYLQRIRDAVADIREFSSFGWLLVFVDAEDRSAGDRAAEVEQVIREAGCPVPYAVFVADCCAETWLLGNRGAFARAELTSELRAHLAFYNVVSRDPEGLPTRGEPHERASYHFRYLQDLLRAMGRSYTKRMAGDTATPAWLAELRRRAAAPEPEGPHLRSFAAMVDFFDQLTSLTPPQPGPGGGDGA